MKKDKTLFVEEAKFLKELVDELITFLSNKSWAKRKKLSADVDITKKGIMRIVKCLGTKASDYKPYKEMAFVYPGCVKPVKGGKRGARKNS
jgi:hypothetical protein